MTSSRTTGFRAAWLTVSVTLCLRAPFVAAEPAPAAASRPVPAASRPTAAPASRPAPTSQTAPAPSLPSAKDSRLSRLERAFRKQQQQLDNLRQASEELADQVTENAGPRKTFSIYGFFDVNFLKIWIPGTTTGAQLFPQDPVFGFGNLNLYFDFKPHSAWRVLTEIRLSLNPLNDAESYENAATGTAFKRVDVTTVDTTHYGSNFSYGSVAIERAQLEWTRYEALSLTVGLFLTPIGIWNIDHGSPAQVQVSSPFAYVNSSTYGSIFPERQLGLMLHGSVGLGELRLGYALTLSNGGGPVATLTDVDADKALGARLQLSAQGTWRWKVGVAGYTGMYSDEKIVVRTVPSLDYLREYTMRYRESILALDVSLEVGPLTFDAELLANWRRYHDDHRPPASLVGAGGSGLAADSIAAGGYAILGYWLPIESLRLLSFLSVGYISRNDTISYDNVIDLSVGLNWRIQSNVVLKVQYGWFHWTEPAERLSLFTGLGNMHALMTQIAVAF